MLITDLVGCKVTIVKKSLCEHPQEWEGVCRGVYLTEGEPWLIVEQTDGSIVKWPVEYEGINHHYSVKAT